MLFERVFKLLMPMQSTVYKGIKLLYYLYVAFVFYKILQTIWYPTGPFILAYLKVFCYSSLVQPSWKTSYPLIEMLDIKGRGSNYWIMKKVQRCNATNLTNLTVDQQLNICRDLLQLNQALLPPATFLVISSSFFYHLCACCLYEVFWS